MVFMVNPELIRIVENIARDRKIDKESIFLDLEEAIISSSKKHFGDLAGVFEVHKAAGSYFGTGCQAGYGSEDTGG